LHSNDWQTFVIIATRHLLAKNVAADVRTYRTRKSGKNRDISVDLPTTQKHQMSGVGDAASEQLVVDCFGTSCPGAEE